MKQFPRMPVPAFWLARESEWRARGAALSTSAALHGWSHQGHSLARAFHRAVRAEGEPLLCAYCDGDLGATSPETIDHHLPESRCRTLGLFELCLSWWNLFPACAVCNSTFKRERWSCLLLRPDTDPVEQLFAFRPRTGELYPSPEQDRVNRARAAKTIHILGLNSAARCQARMKLLRDLRNAHMSGDEERLRELVRAGPYRFVAAYFLSSLTSP